MPNKSTREIKKLARQHATKALGRLIYLVEHGSNEAIQASAANSLLDRGYGKAMQQTQSLNPEGQEKQEISNLAHARWMAHFLTKGVKTDKEKPTTH